MSLPAQFNTSNKFLIIWLANHPYNLSKRYQGDGCLSSFILRLLSQFHNILYIALTDVFKGILSTHFHCLFCFWFGSIYAHFDSGWQALTPRQKCVWTKEINGRHTIQSARRSAFSVMIRKRSHGCRNTVKYVGSLCDFHMCSPTH